MPLDTNNSIEGREGGETFKKVRRQKKEIRQTDRRAPFFFNTLGLTVSLSNPLTFLAGTRVALKINLVILIDYRCTCVDWQDGAGRHIKDGVHVFPRVALKFQSSLYI